MMISLNADFSENLCANYGKNKGKMMKPIGPAFFLPIK